MISKFRAIRLLALLAAVASLASSCVYYNTMYLARRNYERALADVPYAVDKSDLVQGSQFTKTVDYTRKIIEQFPKSKWVDDAYLLWAKATLANDDPRQAVKMLEDFDVRYPNSGLRNEARFFYGVSLRQSRKYERALAAFDSFLVVEPKSEFVPFAQLERSRSLMSLDRPAEAADAASKAIERWGKNPLNVRARIARAEALYAAKKYDLARDDFRALGTRAANDDDRLTYLLRESECLEAGQRLDQALSLLRGAIAHENEPSLTDTTGGRPAAVVTGPGYDRYGRLLTRIGTVHLRANRTDDALASYRKVALLYPRTSLSAEAQYRIGYTYETALDDFDHAREEYAKVRDQSGGSPFADQATNRVASLERLAKFRTAGGADSLQNRAEVEFLLAEQYLFQLEKPERALEEYRRIQKDYAGTEYEPKAILAEAWVLARKFDQPQVADSLWWIVVRQHPGTESQLAARDYLESDGVTVPTELIKMPERLIAKADTIAPLPSPPEGPTPLGEPAAGMPGEGSLPLGAHAGVPLDSMRIGHPGPPPGPVARVAYPGSAPGDAPADAPHPFVAPPTAPATATPRPVARDSSKTVRPFPPDTLRVPPRADTLLVPQPPDTSRETH